MKRQSDMTMKESRLSSARRARDRLRSRLSKQRSPSPDGRWIPLGIHIGIWLLTALTVAALSFTLLWWAFGSPTVAIDRGRLEATTFLDTVKVALAFVAGLGGVVALVVSYRRQRLSELENRRSELASRRDDARLYSERFGAASEQLGSIHSAVRIAGIYALASLADDWQEGRQTCVDVLCAYLRLPYSRSTVGMGDGASTDASEVSVASAPATEPGLTGRLTFPPGEERQVRATVMRTIREHLDSRATSPWWGLRYDFTGATFDDLNLAGAEFRECHIDFSRTELLRDAELSNCIFIDCLIDCHQTQVRERFGFEVCIFRDTTLMFWFDGEGDVNLQAADMDNCKVDLSGSVTFSIVSSWIKNTEIAAWTQQSSSYAMSRSTIDGTKIHITNSNYTQGAHWFNGVKMSGGEILFENNRNWHDVYSPVSDASIELRSISLDQGATICMRKLAFKAGAKVVADDVQMVDGSIRLDDCVVLGGAEVILGVGEHSAGAIHLETLAQQGGLIRLEGQAEHTEAFALGPHTLRKDGQLARSRKARPKNTPATPARSTPDP